MHVCMYMHVLNTPPMNTKFVFKCETGWICYGCSTVNMLLGNMLCNNHNTPIIRCISEVGRARAERKGINRYKIIIVQYKSHLIHFTALTLPWLRPDICIPNNLPPCYVAMNNFGKHREDDDVWYSPPFYSGPQGYKMRLLVYANGRGAGEGTVYVQIIQGQFDDT